ncbi:uncharacterized protein LOC134848879 isoform X2 [Symsagittifera roscoffensis]|uniref:uncharacterized protein LOC134848879 isoform X2 n=1 Tax=Symsagittifera roscoffensis TaxID=84072 RepID=UPI00307C6BD3
MYPMLLKVLKLFIRVAIFFAFCRGASSSLSPTEWVDLPYILTYSPNSYFMSSVRTIYTCNYMQCQIACNTWTANDVSILRYDSSDRNCVCYDYPYGQLYHYLDHPIDTELSTQIFAVRDYLTRDMRPKAETSTTTMT